MTELRWPLLVAVFLLNLSQASSDTPRCHRELETKRLSVYAYSSNALRSLGSEDITCATGPETCKHAFDDDGIDDTCTWVPGQKESVRPRVEFTFEDDVNLLLGRFRCRNYSCHHYINQSVDISQDGDDGAVKAVISADPYDVRGDGWLRFDFKPELLNPENLTLEFPKIAESSNGSWSEFVELELHQTGALTLSGYESACDGTEPGLLRLDVSRPIVAFRLMAKACDLINDSWDVTANIIIIDGTTNIQHVQRFELTLSGSELLIPEEYTDADHLEVDRLHAQKVQINISKPEQLHVYVDIFQDKSKTVLYDSDNVTCVSPGPVDGSWSVDEAGDCGSLTDGDPDTPWSAEENDQLSLLFSQVVSPRRLRIKQQYIKEILVLEGDRCFKVTMKPYEKDSSGWVTIQDSMKGTNFTLYLNELYQETGSIYEVELYGPPLTTPTTTTSSTTFSTSTTPKVTKPTSTTPWTTSTTPTVPTPTGTTSFHTPDTSTTISGKTSITTSTTPGPTTSTTLSPTPVTSELPTSPHTKPSKPTTQTTAMEITTTEDLADTTTPPAQVRPEPTQPSYDGDKLQYHMSMKILARGFEEGMDDVNSSAYWALYDEMLPLFNTSLQMTTDPERIIGYYNVSFRNGSIDMAHNFDLSGLAHIDNSLLEGNLLDVFNASGIAVGDIFIHDPKEIKKVKDLLTVALVSAVACLVVVTTVITVLCVRRRCRRDDDHASISVKHDDSSSGGPHWVPFTVGPVDNRMWQRVDTMTGTPWPSGMMLVAPVEPPVAVNPRESVTSVDGDPAYFSYPENREPPAPPRRGYSMPILSQTSVEELDYWGGPSPAGGTTGGPPVPSNNVRPRRSYVRQVSNESRGTQYSRVNPPSQHSEEHDLDPALFPVPSLTRHVDIHTPSASQDSSANGEEASTSTATFVLPKFYRDNQDTYSGFFISRDMPATDAFEMPSPNPLGLGVSNTESTRRSTTGLHRVESAPELDALDPTNPPFPTMEIESVPSDDEVVLSAGSLSDSSSTKEHKQYDSGYDDALKMYYTDPSLDDRSLMQKISDTFGTKKRPDKIHRNPPLYMLGLDNRKSTTAKAKASREENTV